VQERINVWANIFRRKGKEIKVGFRKVRVDGEWIDWREIEDEKVSKKIVKGLQESRIERVRDRTV